MRRAMLPLPQTAKRRVLRNCRRLETCFDVSPDLIVETKVQECLALLDGPRGRTDERKRFKIETWFSVCFSLDCRGDILGDAAARAKQYSDELAMIAAALLANAAKRRGKSARNQNRTARMRRGQPARPNNLAG